MDDARRIVRSVLSNRDVEDHLRDLAEAGELAGC